MIKYINIFRHLNVDKENFGIAFSGGVDSVVITHYMLSKRMRPELYFFHHGNEDDDIAYQFSKEFANKYGLTLHTNDSPICLKQSEHILREHRYNWLDSIGKPIITGHNLEDVISGYLMFMAKGKAKFIPIVRNNVYRPFLKTSKEDIFEYANKHNLTWFEDPMNHDDRARNITNKEVIKAIELINPGFKNMVRRQNDIFINNSLEELRAKL